MNTGRSSRNAQRRIRAVLALALGVITIGACEPTVGGPGSVETKAVAYMHRAKVGTMAHSSDVRCLPASMHSEQWQTACKVSGRSYMVFALYGHDFRWWIIVDTLEGAYERCTYKANADRSAIVRIPAGCD